MSGCMPGWQAGRLAAGLCRAGHHATAAAAAAALSGRSGCVRVAAGQLSVRGMAAKRGGEVLSPAGPARHTKRPCGHVAAPDFVPLSHTPPRTPSPATADCLGDFFVIDTTPTPVADAAAPASRRGATEVKVVGGVLGLRGGGQDVTGLHQWPRRGADPQVAQRRAINTQAPAAPALASALTQGEDPEAREEVEVVEQQEVEVVEATHDAHVIEVETAQQQQQQQQDEEECETVCVYDSDSSSGSSRSGVGGGGDDTLLVESSDSSSGGGVAVVVDSDSSSSIGDDDGVAVVVENSDSSSDDGVEVDTSGPGFMALGRVPVSRLVNTHIDLSDEVLRRRRHLESLRQWERSWLGHRVARQGLGQGAVPLTVVSYNVLAQSLLRDNPRLYRGCLEEQLCWEYRWALLQHEVKSLEPDVLLLQEVEAGHYFSHYLPWLVARGYEGLYKKRTGNKADGCAIFYNQRGWRLAEHRSVEYCQPAAPEVLDRDNVALIARLLPRHAQDGAAAGVCVATTHLLYNPRRHDVKLAQAALLLAELDRLCYRGQIGGLPQYCPVVLAGDLNAEPHTALLSFLLEGRLHYQGLGRRTLTRHHHGEQELGPELLPPALGITPACQHAALAQGRWLEGQRGPIISPEDKRRLEEALIHIHHSDRVGPAPSAPGAASVRLVQCPGWLTHAFPLQSVYGSQGQRRGRAGQGPGVSTFQERWVCVDYMMYSRARQQADTWQQEPLRLLAHMPLPTPGQAAHFSPMPSDVCPSDHFPLAARFLLHC